MLSSQTRADYVDVTLVGDDSKYNLAHKVVLATSSAKRVHPHPLVNFDIATFRFQNFLVSNFSMFFYGIGIGFEKKWYRKEVLVSVSKKFWYRKKFRYWYRKNFGIEKSIGIGIGKKLVSKKVSVSVSKKIGIGKKFRIRFRLDFGFRHTLLCSMIIFCHITMSSSTFDTPT